MVHTVPRFGVFIFILRGCGYKNVLKMKEILCPDCSSQMKIKRVISKSSATVLCEKCSKEFRVTCDEPSFPESYNKFNWLAFFVPLFWAIGNGAYKWILICALLSALSSIPFLGILFGIFYCIVAVYLGYKANKIAWNRKKWESVEAFEAVQKNTLMGTIIFFVVILVVAIFILIYRA